jgi:hypothetical protein
VPKVFEVDSVGVVEGGCAFANSVVSDERQCDAKDGLKSEKNGPPVPTKEPDEP